MPEKEYIEREAAINEQKRFCGYLDNDMLNRLEIATRRIPAADVVPRKAYTELQAENCKLKNQVWSLKKKIKDMKSDASWEEDIRRGQVQGMW